MNQDPKQEPDFADVEIEVVEEDDGGVVLSMTIGNTSETLIFFDSPVELMLLILEMMEQFELAFPGMVEDLKSGFEKNH